MSARLVQELAADGVPVALTCRVLGISRSGLYEALRRPPSARQLADAALSDNPHFVWDPRLGAQESTKPFVAALLAACVAEGITRLFAFTDLLVCLLAAHSDDFAARGVVCCVPPLAVLQTLQDRFALADHASRYGVHVPSLTPWSDVQTQRVPFPYLVKQRLSAGGAGVRLVRTNEDLDQVRRDWADVAPADIGVHEYVPGDREPSVTLLLGRDGTLVTETWLRKVRYASSSPSTCVVTTERPPQGGAVVELLRTAGLVGIVSAQMKVNARTGDLTLIEVNARPGQNSRILVPLWQRQGVDVGAALLHDRVAAGPPPATPPGVVGVSPVEDLAAVLKHLVRRPGRSHAGSYARSYVRTAARRPVIDAWTTAAARRPIRLGGSLLAQLVRTYREPFDFIPYGDVAAVGEGRP